MEVKKLSKKPKATEPTYLEFTDARVPLAKKPEIDQLIQYSISESLIERQIAAIEAELNKPDIKPTTKDYLQKKLADIKTTESVLPLDLGVSKVPLKENPKLREVKQYLMK